MSSAMPAIKRTATVAVLAACVCATAASATPRHAHHDPAAEALGRGGSPQARVVSVDVITPPKRLVFRHRFRPWATPTPAQVRRIIDVEADRWKVSEAALRRRVWCESTFRWNARNGPYRGLLQFHPSTFRRGLQTLGDRRVRMVRAKRRTLRRVKVIRYSDGRVKRKRGRRVTQKVKHVYLGRLPRRPPLTHGWAQIRIGSQALAGKSAVRASEWECR